MINNADVQNSFKGLVDVATTALKRIADNFSGFKTTVIGILASIGSYKLFGKLTDLSNDWLKGQKAQLKDLKDDYKKTFDAIDKMENSTFQYKMKQGKIEGHVNTNVLGAKPSTKEVEKWNRLINEANTNLVEQQKITANINANTGLLGKSLRGISIIIKGIGNALWAMGINAIISVVIGGLTKILGTLRDIHKENKRIKELSKTFAEEDALAVKR